MFSGLKGKWDLDFSSKVKSDKQEVDPPGGFSKNFVVKESTSSDQGQSLIENKSYEIAWGPFKSIPMNLFIMWMIGGSVHMFSIMMIVMLIGKHIQAFFTINETFKTCGSLSNGLLKQKFIFVMGNFLMLCLAFYKCSSIGLLPTKPSDWIDLNRNIEYLETLSGHSS